MYLMWGSGRHSTTRLQPRSGSFLFLEAKFKKPKSLLSRFAKHNFSFTPNKDGRPSAESEEGRPVIEESTHQLHTFPTQSGIERVPEAGECAASSRKLRR
jgi:hypothetical protein